MQQPPLRLLCGGGARGGDRHRRVRGTVCAGDGTALWIVEEDGSEQRYSFAEMAGRSNQVANWLR
ncbi:hypothetical protein AB0C29_32625, partial [Actinoplanes sp. NPDC048791]|uniref:hypothetical protein n=1 Tax=Actinoplanes sp. NPDC048791 TaxID=3154623 RepID=UPI0033EC62D3